MVHPVWRDDEGGWTESECTSSSEVYEHNAESLALVGRSGQAIEDWKLARVALSCHRCLGPSLPRNVGMDQFFFVCDFLGSGDCMKVGRTCQSLALAFFFLFFFKKNA